jgi:peptidoglycan/xylan/chitin deacetylase (PgdA/CDA1 family)
MVLIVILVLSGIAVLAHTAPFPFLFDYAKSEISVWRMPESANRKIVFLTFDDGPNPTATPGLLDLLKEKKVHATFFLIDRYVNQETAPIVRRMFEEGHAVGQHSDDRWLMLNSSGKLGEKLRAAAARVESLAGSRPCPIFRPHAGWRSISMLRGVGRLKYRLIGWSWMTWDWYWFRKRTADRVAAQVVSHIGPGKIVVIHDGHHKNPRADRRYAIDATGKIIDTLRARGYEFATLCH